MTDRPRPRHLIALSLALVTLLSACAPVLAGQGTLDQTAAGYQHDEIALVQSQELHERPAPEGVVDISEGPVVHEPSPEAAYTPPDPGSWHFDPSPVLAQSEAVDWSAGQLGPTLELELRNGCGSALDYAFAPSAEPGGALQALAPHVAQDQVVPEGWWLHLWADGDWLGSAMTLVDGGTLEVAPGCDRLSASLDPDGPSQLSISLHAAEPSQRAELPDPGELAEVEAASSRWSEAGDEGVKLRLANLCEEPVDYGFSAEHPRAGAPEQAGTLAGLSVVELEVPAGWWLQYHAEGDDWRGGASIDQRGGVLWIEGNCRDFGVADGVVFGVGGVAL